MKSAHIIRIGMLEGGNWLWGYKIMVSYLFFIVKIVWMCLLICWKESCADENTIYE
jgi:hypothetical protein